MGSYRGGGFFTNMASGKGGGMNANPGLRQQQMGLVPSYTPMQTMGGKGGGKGAPTQNPLPGGGQIPNQDFMMAGQTRFPQYLRPYFENLVNNAETGEFGTGKLGERNPVNQGPSYGGAPAYQQPTQQPITSPQPFDVSQFGQPGGPGYRPTGNEGGPGYRPMIQLQDKTLTDAASIAGRPVNSFAEASAILAGRFPSTSGAGGMRLSRDGYPTRAEIERLTGMAIRPGDRQGEINRYNRFMQNQGQTTQTSEMFGTTAARTPAEQALLTRRQAELNAMQAQQNELAAQQEEYDKMFGGLTEEQQAFFGDQLQRPEQPPQSGITFDDFMRRQLLNNLFQTGGFSLQPAFGLPRLMQQYTGGIFPQPYNPNRG